MIVSWIRVSVEDSIVVEGSDMTVNETVCIQN